MNPEVPTALAQRGRDAYAILLTAFRGALGNALDTAQPASQQVREALRRELIALGQSWLDDEADTILAEVRASGYAAVRELDAAVRMAPELSPQTADDLDNEIQAHLERLAEDLDQALRLQIERDIALAMRCLRDASLTGALRARRNAAGHQRARGAAETARGALSALVFEFVDRSGRRWPSPRHVMVLWRHALILAWNETALLRAAQIGLRALQVDHPDASYGNRGVLVSTADQDETFEGEDLLPWLEVRQEVFHPNSVAWLRPVDAAISQK